MDTVTGKRNLLASMLIGIIFPMIFGLGLSNFFPDWRWSNYPFHAMVESVGSLSALIIATLMIIMINHHHLPRRFIVVACALISMGLLDGFHSVLHVSISFVWLHSIATMVGGIIFSAVWISSAWLTDKRKGFLLFSTVTASLLAGIISVVMPDILPTMIIDGRFSLIARIINLAGGIGFLIGSSFFVYAYYSQTKESSTTKEMLSENLIFANHCLLFGIAGLLFETSVLWDAGWWWWHILRFLAYFVVLIYFFILFKKSQDQLIYDEIKLQNMNDDLELQVRERTSQLVKANQAKSDFLSQMSHELRTPLNAILGFGQLLEMDKEGFNKQQQGNVQEILEAGSHLLTLINDVLDLTKIESGKMEVSIEAIPLDDVLQQCIALISLQAETRQLELIDNISNKGYTVLADFTRLKQVVLNFLSNAVKYNSECGRISLNSEIIDKDRIRISITDTGKGFCKDDIDILYAPFERLDVENNIEGTGIGLVITKHLIELMNGTTGVESILGEGSTFWFEIELSHDI